MEDNRKRVIIKEVNKVSTRPVKNVSNKTIKKCVSPIERVNVVGHNTSKNVVTTTSTNSNTNHFSFLKLIKSGIRAGIVYLCIYAGATMLGDGKVEKFVLEREKSEEIHNTDVMFGEVSDKLGIDSEKKDNMVLFYAVMNNQNLEEDEKEIFYRFSDLIDENPYLDVNLSYDNLDDLDIVYTDRPSNYNSDVMGIFSLNDDVISIFRSKSEDNREILIHEMIHSIFNTRRTCYLPSFLSEGVTELLVDEYFTSNPFVETTTYPFEVSAVKLLCEMVGSEKVLNCYTTGNKEVIVKELSKTMGEDLSSQFMKNMEGVFNSFQNGVDIDSFQFDQMLSYIDVFFATRFSENQNQVMADQYYYYRNILNMMRSSSCYEDYFYYLYDNGVFEKAYFSRKLKERYPLVERVNVDGSTYNGVIYQYTLGE